MRYKKPTPHTPPPRSREGDKLHLKLAKHAQRTGVLPRGVVLLDDNGIAHGVTLNAQLFCNQEPPKGKLEYGAMTCLACVARWAA